MKLLLLQPPVQDFYDTDIRLQPIGLCYLKAAVQKYLPGVKVIVKDYHQGWGRRTLPVPKELSYLKDFYAWPDESPFSSFFQYFHFGAPFEVLAEDVAREKPDMVGIASLFSPYYREVLRTADEIKKRIPVPILAGGSHVSAVPDQMLKHPSIDFVIRGEGEKPLVEFLKVWNNGRHLEQIPNLGFKKNGALVLNEIGENYPLEELPLPDLSDLPHDQYLFEKQPLSFVITSRSCPHRCSFCSVHTTFGTRFRRRSSQWVLEEIQERYRQGIRVFDFEDDNLTFYVGEMKKLCRRLIEAFPERDVRFLAMNGISYLSLDPELLSLMRQAGFTHLNIALVSSDITVRETTKRPHTVRKYLEVVQEAVRLGFKIVSYQILGLPNESLDSMIQTLTFAARLPVLLGASMFYLTPNSPIAKGFGERSEEDIFKSRLTAMAIETDHFKREDIYTLFITTRIINFLKGLHFKENQIDLAKALQIARRTDKRSAIGAELIEKLFTEQRLYAFTAEDAPGLPGVSGAVPARDRPRAGGQAKRGPLTQKGFKPLPRFNFLLFSRVWSALNAIATQERNVIIPPFYAQESTPKETPGHLPRSGT